MADQTEWHAYLADDTRHIVTDPDAIAALLVDEQGRGTISIRRGNALPDEHGHLPGTWRSLDIFGEVDLEDIEPDEAAEAWQLTQAATHGLNAANLREQWAAVYADGDWTAGETWSRAEAEDIISRDTVESRPVLARRWTSDWQHVETEVEQP